MLCMYFFICIFVLKVHLPYIFQLIVLIPPFPYTAPSNITCFLAAGIFYCVNKQLNVVFVDGNNKSEKTGYTVVELVNSIVHQ